MKRFDSAYRSATTKVSAASTKTVRDYAAMRLPDEPAITVALATRISDGLDRHSSGGITWSAKVLSSHKEEPRYGADFLGLLSLRLPGYSVTKGYLAQAKRQEPGKGMSNNEWTRLQKQCEKMLNFTIESFVFIYSFNGVFVVPALSVLACASSEDLHLLNPKPMGRFFREHLECYVGDPRINTPDLRVLDQLPFRVGLQVAASFDPLPGGLFGNDT